MEALSSRAARAVVIALAVLAGAWVSWLLGSIEAGPLTAALERFAAPVIAGGAALACLARAVLVARERPGWLMLGLASLAWAAGELAASDVRLGFPPLAAAGLVLLARPRARGTCARRTHDALAAGLAAAALAAALPLDAALGYGGVALGYAGGDLILVAVLAGAAVLTVWPRDPALGWVATGILLFAAVDAAALQRAATGADVPPGLTASGSSAALLMLAWAAWRTPAPAAPGPPGWWSDALAPAAFGTIALAVLAHEGVAPTHGAGVVLAVASIAVLLARLGLERAPAPIHHDEPDRAVLDLVARAELPAELDRRLPSANRERPLLFALFALDDLPQYIDLFGAAAGQALFARLGEGLVAVLGERGTVLRTAPAELCAFVELDGQGPDRLLSLAAASLYAEGEGFAIGCSQGAALLPAEAASGRDAVRLAEERLRAQQAERADGRSDRAGAAFADALAEREGERRGHRRELAELAEGTARKLGVPELEVEQIRVAAGLHDVGKMAIPGAILNKPGPLDNAEWEFVRAHTAIGERIVAAAPDLAAAAAIVRSVHERWDGAGYPDGLSGRVIPLGARIVAVCGAYDAMTTNRPHRRAMPVPAALGELRRCAGVQFDPDVVEAFCLALLDHPVERS